jgi:dolichyl-phosphate beta-glucosyltransferase
MISMPSGLHLSVIIPAFNEESRLPGTLRHVGGYLAAQPYESEVLVIDDGSADGTAQAVHSCAGAAPLRLIQHPDRANHGKGASVRRGMIAARGKFRLFMDADNSTTLDQIDVLWPCFEQGYDVAVGSRRAPGARVDVHQAWYKELAGRCGNLVIRALAVPGIADTQAGFKMFTDRAAAAIFQRQTIDRWGYDIEIFVIARLLGYRVREVPIVWIDAPGSKVRMSSYLQVLQEVWRIRRNVKSGTYLRSL